MPSSNSYYRIVFVFLQNLYSLTVCISMLQLYIYLAKSSYVVVLLFYVRVFILDGSSECIAQVCVVRNRKFDLVKVYVSINSTVKRAQRVLSYNLI